MSGTLALCMNLSEIEAVGDLRLQPGIEVCPEDGQCWVRILEPVESQLEMFRILPGQQFSVLSDGQLIPAGSGLPKGHLPNGPWHPIAKWIRPELESAKFPPKSAERVPLKLVRGGRVEMPSLLLADGADWLAFAVQAPRLRLDRLAFATDSHQRVLIRGQPLPVIPGTAWYERSGIGVPCGFTWSPAIEADIVREMLGLEGHELALWFPGGAIELIREEDFVRASRANVRASMVMGNE